MVRPRRVSLLDECRRRRRRRCCCCCCCCCCVSWIFLICRGVGGNGPWLVGRTAATPRGCDTIGRRPPPSSANERAIKIKKKKRNTHTHTHTHTKGKQSIVTLYGIIRQNPVNYVHSFFIAFIKSKKIVIPRLPGYFHPVFAVSLREFSHPKGKRTCRRRRRPQNIFSTFLMKEINK